MNISFATDGIPCCIFSLHATTRTRKSVGGADSAWLHYPFIELRTLSIMTDESTGKLSSEIIGRCFFEPKEAEGCEEPSAALSIARAWIVANRETMPTTLQDDYGNGLP